MPRLASALRAASAAALMGGFACLGTATATADPSPEVNTLTGSLSRGYNADNCTAQPPPEGVLAAIQCGQNTDPNGPAHCGETESPTVWGQQQGTTAGQVACGTAQGVAQITWTTDAKNVVSLVRASNADVLALYGWWRTRG
jgi:hypothetical protein